MLHSLEDDMRGAFAGKQSGTPSRSWPSTMKRVLRKAIFAIPFGCLTAIAAHTVRFGDDHAFGGDAHELLVATAVVGSTAIALAILHAFLTAGSTAVTGTIAAARAGELIPNAATIFLPAAGVYYGIESLEGHGIEIGLPTLLIGALAAALAAALRTLVAHLAGIVADLVRDWIARLDRCTGRTRFRPRRSRPIHSHVAYATRRLGRAPPRRRWFS
jgi:hypothetical protein